MSTGGAGAPTTVGVARRRARPIDEPRPLGHTRTRSPLPWTSPPFSATTPIRSSTHVSKGIPKDDLTSPAPTSSTGSGPLSDRPPQVLRNLQSLYDHGRLGGTGYVSILPVDQGIEHSAAASFAPEPAVLRPGEHRRAGDRRRLQRGGHARSACSASVSRKYAHKIPFIVKLNHNELLTLPEQVRPDHVRHRSSRPTTWARPASARRSTSAPTSRRARSRRSARRSPRRTSSACSPCCGATCATPRSRQATSTTTSPPTSPARPTTSA